MTHDVLEHHDGVVHYETDGERERHQRQVVEAIAQHPHHRAGTDQRERQRQRGDDGGPEIPEEQEDHHHDEADREHERELHVVDARLDRDGAVVDRYDADAGRQLRLELLEDRIDALGDIHRVDAGLPDDGERGVGASVDLTHAAHVLQAVNHVAEFAETNRRAVAHGDDEIAELGGVAELSGGLQRK